MGLILTSPPPGGREAVSETVALLAKARSSGEMSLAGSGEMEQRQLVSPQKVYQIPLDAMTKEDPLQFAKPVAWRYLIIEGDSPVEAAETTLGGTEAIRFSQINRGPQVAGFVEAVHNAEAIAEHHPGQEWELRYLRIPALYVDALWLCSVQDTIQGQRENDLLLPISPLFPPLEANHSYSVEKFFEVLHARAIRRLENNDATIG